MGKRNGTAGEARLSEFELTMDTRHRACMLEHPVSSFPIHLVSPGGDILDQTLLSRLNGFRIQYAVGALHVNPGERDITLTLEVNRGHSTTLKGRLRRHDSFFGPEKQLTKHRPGMFSSATSQVNTASQCRCHSARDRFDGYTTRKGGKETPISHSFLFI